MKLIFCLYINIKVSCKVILSLLLGMTKQAFSKLGLFFRWKWPNMFKVHIYKEKSVTAAFVFFMMQNIRACVRFFRKKANKCKIFENLGKNLQNLKIF